MITIPNKIQLNPIFHGFIGHLGCTAHTPRSFITVGQDMRKSSPQFFVSLPASRFVKERFLLKNISQDLQQLSPAIYQNHINNSSIQQCYQKIFISPHER